MASMGDLKISKYYVKHTLKFCQIKILPSPAQLSLYCRNFYGKSFTNAVKIAISSMHTGQKIAR
jgi:hypothetical protein